MNRLAADEAAIIASATMTVGRTPKRCMAAAAKGPVRPKRKMPIATARLMVWRDQPKAWPQGTVRTPGADLQSRHHQQRGKDDGHHRQGIVPAEESASCHARNLAYPKRDYARHPCMAGRMDGGFRRPYFSVAADLLIPEPMPPEQLSLTLPYAAWAGAFTPSELDRVEASGYPPH